MNDWKFYIVMGVFGLFILFGTFMAGYTYALEHLEPVIACVM